MARAGFLDVLRFENLFRMGVLWTLAVILSYLKLLCQKVCRSRGVNSFPRLPPENAPVTGLACIVTGASSGIGKSTAEALALHGYHVILAGRSMNRLLKVKSELTRKHRSISIEALELDLCSADSILSFKNEVEKSLQNCRPALQLQLLVNNAGILASFQRWTEHGFDSMMASNYLGPYLLTQQLLAILRKGPHARIVNVSSFTHRCVKNLNIGEKELAEGSMQSPSEDDWFRVAQIYETSKLCILLFTYELHRRVSDITASSKISVLAADPGIVKTNIMRELPNWLEVVAHFVLKPLGLLQSPQTGAIAVIDAALAPEPNNDNVHAVVSKFETIVPSCPTIGFRFIPKGLSGKYFFGGGGRILESSFLSYNSDLQRQLWEATSRVCSAQSSRAEDSFRYQG